MFIEEKPIVMMRAMEAKSIDSSPQVATQHTVTRCIDCPTDNTAWRMTTETWSITKAWGDTGSW